MGRKSIGPQPPDDAPPVSSLSASRSGEATSETFFARLRKFLLVPATQVLQSDAFAKVLVGVVVAVLATGWTGARDTFLLWLNPRQYLVGQYTGVWHWKENGQDRVDRDLVYIDQVSDLGGTNIGKISGHGISPTLGSYKIQGFKRNGFVSLTYYCDPGTAQPTRVGSAILVINPVDDGLLSGSWYGLDEHLVNPTEGPVELIKSGWEPNQPIGEPGNTQSPHTLSIIISPPNPDTDLFVDDQPYGTILNGHMTLTLPQGLHSLVVKSASSGDLKKPIYITGDSDQNLAFTVSVKPENETAPTSGPQSASISAKTASSR